MKHNHIALMGDSIFDNDRYTAGKADVAACLRQRVEGFVTLFAVDGATTETFRPQFARLNETDDIYTHVVLSLGGNDALQSMDLMDGSRRAPAVFAELAKRVARFEKNYRAIVDRLLGPDQLANLTLCTIYNGHFDDPTFGAAARMALCPFNDVIQRVAQEHELRLLDLRPVCTEARDYTLQIEPSAIGGRKIAEAIAQVVSA